MKKPVRLAATLAAALALSLPLYAHARSPWLMPSATVLSGNGAWVTFDGSMGDDTFYPDHALHLDGLAIQAPDGSAAQADNGNEGKLRSTFDVDIRQPGTYRIAIADDTVFARWEENGQRKRYFGKADGLAGAVPAKAEDLHISQNLNRAETFVTLGKPSMPRDDATQGLALVPVTHPNDLYAGDTATFRFLLDGKPAANLDVEVIASGSRYRDQPGGSKLKTGTDGSFKVTWPAPGMYLVHAQAEDKSTSVPHAEMRRMSYGATLEVLPQ